MMISGFFSNKTKLNKKTLFLYIYYFIFPIFTVLIILISISNYLPPASIKILSGPKNGFFAEVAEGLKSDLVQYGVKADIVYLQQSTEIIDIIQQDEGGIGFLAHEIASDDYKDVYSFGAIAIEPLIIAARHDSGLNDIRQLKGLRLVVGPIGSGVRHLSEKILSLYGINNNNSLFLDVEYSQSVTELIDGRADAAFFLLPVNSLFIKEVSKNHALRLVAINESKAVANKFKHVTNVSIPRGAFQIEPVMPGVNVSTVALPITLIAHQNSGVGLGGLIASILAKRYDKERFFAEDQKFPEFIYDELKPMPVAEDIYANGEPALTQYIGLKYGIILSYAADPFVLVLLSLVVFLGVVITYTEIIPVLITVAYLFRSKK